MRPATPEKRTRTHAPGRGHDLIAQARQAHVPGRADLDQLFGELADALEAQISGVGKAA